MEIGSMMGRSVEEHVRGKQGEDRRVEGTAKEKGAERDLWK